MDTIMYIIIFTIGFVIGIITTLFAWLRTISDSITKIDIKITKLQAESESEDKGTLSWLGKNCKDCGNEKCKRLGTITKGHDCALWQPKVESQSIKMVTNAKEAEKYPISEDKSKIIEAINKLLFKEDKE